MFFKPIGNYGGKSPHFNLMVGNQVWFRIAFNVKSQAEPSTLLYDADDCFDQPILKYLQQLP